MKLFGFSITRSKPAPVTRSFDTTAWLTGTEQNSAPSLANAYQQVVWVYRAINVLAEQVANIPFLFSSGERGRENLITSGPLLDFYAHPHPHINSFQYWELRILWLMLRGECMRIPIYSDNPHLDPQPLELREPNFPYRLVEPRRAPRAARKLVRVLLLDPALFQHIIQNHQLVGWRYTGNANAPIESQVFLPEEVWFEKLPNPYDFWRGMSPLSCASLPAKTDFAASSFMQGLLENNADLGVIVRTDQQLDDTQQEQILAALRQRKRRAGTADRP